MADNGETADLTERPEDTVRRFARQLVAVQSIHTKRTFDGDGYGWSICVEDRQSWPCATVQAIERANDE